MCECVLHTQQCVLWVDVCPSGQHGSIDGLLSLLMEITHYTKTSEIQESVSMYNRSHKKTKQQQVLVMRGRIWNKEFHLNSEAKTVERQKVSTCKMISVTGVSAQSPQTTQWGKVSVVSVWFYTPPPPLTPLSKCQSSDHSKDNTYDFFSSLFSHSDQQCR